jgi:hypothetical protein
MNGQGDDGGSLREQHERRASRLMGRWGPDALNQRRQQIVNAVFSDNSIEGIPLLLGIGAGLFAAFWAYRKLDSSLGEMAVAAVVVGFVVSGLCAKLPKSMACVALAGAVYWLLAERGLI